MTRTHLLLGLLFVGVLVTVSYAVDNDVDNQATSLSSLTPAERLTKLIAASEATLKRIATKKTAAKHAPQRPATKEAKNGKSKGKGKVKGKGKGKNVSQTQKTDWTAMLKEVRKEMALVAKTMTTVIKKPASAAVKKNKNTANMQKLMKKAQAEVKQTKASLAAPKVQRKARLNRLRKNLTKLRAMVKAELQRVTKATAAATHRVEALQDKQKLLQLQVRLGAEAIKQASVTQPKLMKAARAQMALVAKLRGELARAAEYLDAVNSVAPVLTRPVRSFLEMEAVSELENPHAVMHPLHRMRPFGAFSLNEVTATAHTASLSESESNTELWAAPKAFQAPQDARDNDYAAVRLRVTPDEVLSTPMEAATVGLCVTVMDGAFEGGVASVSALSVMPCSAASREAQVWLLHPLSGRAHLAEHPDVMLTTSDGLLKLTKDVKKANAFSVSKSKHSAALVFDRKTLAPLGCLAPNPRVGDVTLSTQLLSAKQMASCLKIRAVPTALTAECRSLRTASKVKHDELRRVNSAMQALSAASLVKVIDSTPGFEFRFKALQQQADGYVASLTATAQGLVKSCDKTLTKFMAHKKAAHKALQKASTRLTDLVRKLKSALANTGYGTSELKADQAELARVKKTLKALASTLKDLKERRQYRELVAKEATVAQEAAALKAKTV